MLFTGWFTEEMLSPRLAVAASYQTVTITPNTGKAAGPHLNINTVFFGVGIPIIKARQSHNNLIFIMRIFILVNYFLILRQPQVITQVLYANFQNSYNTINSSYLIARYMYWVFFVSLNCKIFPASPSVIFGLKHVILNHIVQGLQCYPVININMTEYHFTVRPVKMISNKWKIIAI